VLLEHEHLVAIEEGHRDRLLEARSGHPHGKIGIDELRRLRRRRAGEHERCREGEHDGA
jgi:hypothetical protein